MGHDGPEHRVLMGMPEPWLHPRLGVARLAGGEPLPPPTAEPPERGAPLNATRRDFRRFHLYRSEDVSGTSGIGVVAEGIQFSTGACVMAWTTKHRSVAVYQTLSELIAIHGHDGRTQVVWIDRP